MDIKHISKEKSGEFFLEIDGNRIGEMTYRLDKENRMLIDHTEVFDKEKGSGVAKELIHSGIEFARSHNHKVIAYCTYAKHVIEKTPEYQDVLAK